MGMSKLKANMDVAMRENSVIYLEDNFKKNMMDLIQNLKVILFLV